MDYGEIVARFRELTRWTWESGSCCEDVRDGAPRCCYRVVDGEELQFTYTEALALSSTAILDDDRFVRREGRVWLNREVWHSQKLVNALKDGWLADTLECAAHPPRPIVLRDGFGQLSRVVGVAVVPDCNTPIALKIYRYHRQELMELWQRAVDLTGAKPYYVTDWVDDGLIVL